MNDDCLSLYIILKYLSWSRFIFLLFARLWHIHIKGQYLNCELTNELISMCLLLIFKRGAILANALIFLLDFSICSYRDMAIERQLIINLDL